MFERYIQESNIRGYFRNPLYKNSYYMLLTSIVTSIASFLFWIIAARFYSVNEVGLATTLISAITFVAGFSTLGFNWGIIRFLPNEENKKDMVNSCLVVTAISTIGLSIIFISSAHIFSPALTFLSSELLISLSFIIFTALVSLLEFQKRFFLASRKADYACLQSLLNNTLKILIILCALSLGTFGIFFSWGLSAAVAFCFALFFLIPRTLTGYSPSIQFNLPSISKLFHFSFGNYIAENLWALPRNLLPLIIISLLSTEMTAYFYISWSVANILFLIPMMFSASLVVEGSYSQENFRATSICAIKSTLMLLLPAILAMILFGRDVLAIFGEEYAENAYLLLSILALSSIPLTFVEFFVSVQRVWKNIKAIIIYYGLIAVIALSMTYLLIPQIGIIGVGIGWLAAQTIIAIIQGLQIRREMRN